MVRHYSQYLKPLTIDNIRDLAAEREKAMHLSQNKSLVGYLDKLLSKPHLSSSGMRLSGKEKTSITPKGKNK